MMSLQSADPSTFFTAMHERFGQILAAGRGRSDLIETITSQAFDLFERNVAIGTENLPALACHKGCPACCCIRVTATAPEVFLLATYLRRVDETPAGAQLDLPGRVAKADESARNLDPQQRMAARCHCPLMLKDTCVIHPVRPLACRGHAAFDKDACAEAAAGHAVEVPISETHLLMRSLVQSALQSALRAHGYAWQAYELNHALHLALMQDTCQSEWCDGADSLAPALVKDTDWQALADAFDRLHLPS